MSSAVNKSSKNSKSNNIQQYSRSSSRKLFQDDTYMSSENLIKRPLPENEIDSLLYTKVADEAMLLRQNLYKSSSQNDEKDALILYKRNLKKFSDNNFIDSNTEKQRVFYLINTINMLLSFDKDSLVLANEALSSI